MPWAGYARRLAVAELATLRVNERTRRLFDLDRTRVNQKSIKRKAEHIGGAYEQTRMEHDDDTLLCSVFSRRVWFVVGDRVCMESRYGTEFRARDNLGF